MLDITAMRRVIEVAAERVDYSKPVFQAQIAAIDMQALKATLERLALRCLVLTHAHEVMESGLYPHPMQAYIHAAQCEGPISDTEFFGGLEAWAKLCGYRPNENVIIMGGGSERG
jgi:hypothetical protein